MNRFLILTQILLSLCPLSITICIKEKKLENNQAYFLYNEILKYTVSFYIAMNNLSNVRDSLKQNLVLIFLLIL